MRGPRSLLVLLAACATCAHGVVIGIDFGARFLKIAAIRPGAGIDMVFNEASKRKSSSAVAFNAEDERVLGDDAYNLAPKLPMRTYLYAKTLLGKGMGSPAVEALVKMGYPYDFYENATTKSLSFKQDAEVSYLVEELAAFILSYAKQISEAHVGQVVRDCVLTVPPFWRATERLSLLRAAEIAGLNVLSLVHETTAVAFKYGFDKESLFVEKPLNAVFYDLGASSFKVAVVEFSATVGKKNKTQGAMTVKGVAWDEDLGGRYFDNCVADYLADEFIKAYPKQGATLRGSPRGMAKIRKEAERIKEVLSANVEIPVAIEALHEDTDFRTVMKRGEFEKRCDHLWDRFEPPLKKALEQAGLEPSQVDKVEIVGGATRIPRVKEVAKKFFGRDTLDMSLNGDEACALGAALYAAKMSTSFRLREFGITDYFPYQVSVRMGGSGSGFDADAEAGTSGGKEQVLFARGSKFPHKKILSVSRTEDFAVEALLEGESFAAINVSGVADAISGVKTDKREPEGKPKASITFQLTSDGIPEVAKAEVMMDVMETYEEWVVVNKTEENTTEDGAAEGEAEGEEKAAEGEKAEGEKAEEGAEEAGEAKGAKDKKKGAKDKKKDKKKDKDLPKEKVTKTAKRVHHVALSSESAFTTAIRPINSTIVSQCIARNKLMLEEEALRRRDAEAKNRLESYILATRDRMSEQEEAVAKVTTDKQRKQVGNDFEKGEDWLYEGGRSVGAAEYEAKLKEMQALADPIFFRMNEMEARPEAVKRARERIEAARELIATWEESKPQITAEEREKALEHCKNTTEWLDTQEKAQAKKKAHEDPAFTSDEVDKKLAPLEKGIRILNKRPAPKPPKVEANATADNETATEDGANAADGASAEGEGEADAADATTADAKAADSETSANGEAEGDSKKDEL